MKIIPSREFFSPRVRSGTAWGLVLCFLLGLGISSAAAAGEHSLPYRLSVENYSGPVERVPAWDERSPQRLVRLSSGLAQHDGDYYYRVVPNQITIGLADGFESWSEVVEQALAIDAQAFAALEKLRVIRSNRLGIVDLKTPAGAKLVDLCRLVHRSGLVRFAEVATFGTYTAVPADPRYDEQWALDNTGQTGGTSGADVDAEAAWDLTAGDPGIVVAVIDSGTEIDHEDLALNLWINEDEIPDNGIDDDGNGYIDDYEGWDFDNNDNDPRSNYFHGTHVAGIIYAATDNGIGIAGLAGGFGGRGISGMALGVGENSPNGAVLDDAIIYAADNGAHIITLSLSVGETTAINDALDYAYNSKDVFIDCAAGNNGSSVGYPARRSEVMSVASTDHNDNKSGFSNPGPENEVAAPGTDILSTQLNNGYGTSSGTSFAAPYVAGVAALVRTRNPGLPAPDVRQLIIDSSEDVGPAGFDNGTGWGRVNAYEAVSLAGNSDGMVRLDQDEYSCVDEIRITVTDIDLSGDGTTEVTINSDSEPDGEVVRLDETGTNSGVFRGTIATAEGGASADGVLQVTHADTITVEYIDADDGNGGTNVVKTDTALADCAAPLISQVETTDITVDSANVNWQTDEVSTSVVRFGSVVPPSDERSVQGLVTTHQVPLTGLAECTIYKYEVESTDAQGNTAIDDNGGQYYSFETYGTFPDIGVAPCHRGQAELDKAEYGCSDLVIVRVTDIDLNQDPGVVETVEVLMTSTSEPDGEVITLTELDVDNSRFEGSIQLTETSMAGDGLLGVAAGDLISVTYEDEDGGDGAARSSVDTSRADCVAPDISNIRVTALTNTRFAIEWDTDEPATSRVEYGETPALGMVVEDSALKTAHRLVMTGFSACDRLYFRVASADLRGDEIAADAGGSPFEFNINQIGGLLFYDGFENGTAWDLTGEWEQGAPQGQGSYSGDPGEAYSGGQVIGNDLAGLGSFAGDYEPNATESATTPVLDATGFQNLELIYRRKLGVQSGDSASIQTLTVGVTSVWSSSGSTIRDTGWVERRHDLSNSADGRSNLRVVFQLDSDESGQSFGWNLDEVIIKDASQPDYLACGGCAGAPTFEGASAVQDEDACAAGGLRIDWESAPAWGTGSGGTYDIYRSSSPTFVPDSGNRIASGIDATTYLDASAPVDAEAWYIVRARNNESCSADGGLSDDNLVRLSGTETTTRAPAQSPGAALRLSRIGRAHVRLAWQPTADTDHYLIRRSDFADFSSPQDLATTTSLFFEDEDAATNAKNYFYRFVSVNACGDETP